MDMWPFGDKGKGAPPSAGKAKSAPTDRVRQLFSQGLSEPEIIRTLKDEGYTPIEVDNAMRGALKGAVGGFRSESGPPGSQNRSGFGPTVQKPDEFEYGEMPKPPQAEFENDNLGMPRLPGEKMPSSEEEEDEFEPPPRLLPPRPSQARHEMEEPFRKLSGVDERKEERRRAIEELIESIVEEKWNEIRGELGEVANRFHQVDSKIADLELTLHQITNDKKSDIEEIETKIDTYKQSISEVSSRMESVERAMKDSLTPMLQSLRSLSDTIKSLKGSKE